MKDKSIFIYNPWTGVVHGHARNELNIAKEFLQQNGKEAKILSSQDNYGDIHFDVHRSMLSKLPNVLQRGNLFRYIRTQEQKIQATSLANLLSALAYDHPLHLVVTSSKPSDLILFRDIKFEDISLSIRVISPPESPREIEAFLVLNKSKNINIAFETYDGTTKTEALGGRNLLTVPPIQGMANLTKKRGEKSIGIFWPVSYFEPEGAVRFLLETLAQQHCIIRLPGNIDQASILKDFPKNTYINRGISDADFNHYVNQTKIAILPHKGYKFRGSGLAAIFAGMAIPILTDTSNSFFADIVGKSDIRQITQDVLRDIDSIKIVDGEEKQNVNEYHKWTRLQWTKFLEAPGINS